MEQSGSFPESDVKERVSLPRSVLVYEVQALWDGHTKHATWWVDEGGRSVQRDDVACPDGYHWSTPWQSESDHGGWEYACALTADQWESVATPDAHVRRRRWVRHCQPLRALPGRSDERVVADARLSESAVLSGEGRHLRPPSAEHAHSLADVPSSPTLGPTASSVSLSSGGTAGTKGTGHRGAASQGSGGGALRIVHDRDQGTCALVDEIVYENQRSGLVGGFSTKWLIPYVDKRGEWSRADGTSCQSVDEFKLSLGWTWTGPWVCIKDASCDSEGWQYAFSFWDSQWLPAVGPRLFVRRRCWKRVRQLLLDDSNILTIQGVEENTGNAIAVNWALVASLAALFALLFSSINTMWQATSLADSLLARIEI